MDTDPPPSESLQHKSEALKTLTSGPISSSLSKLNESSRVLPSEKDFHFYNNFTEFQSPIHVIDSISHSMLEKIASSKRYPLPRDVEEEGCDWLVNVNDDVVEKFDESLDEFLLLRKEQEEGEKNEFELRKKKKEESVSVNVRVVERDKKTIGGKAKIPFHLSTIKRPQDEYNILVNNSNQPFQHVWLERSEDGSRVMHPLEKLSVLDFVDRKIESHDPVKPPPLESTPFKLVEDVKDLKDLAAKLCRVNEFAVDLEHNQYRSFQGLTCLMQISTRSEDFVVDTLKLRIHIGPYLREVFKDPTKRKVMHGADRDIVWLQRDFGIYVCNLFDTGQASRVMQLERYSLEYLLQHFCEIAANKEYQNADWRLRPLPREMIRYAREDTHYLLYIYDLMKIKLLSEPTDAANSDDLLLEVYKRSYDVCMQLYEKELLTDTSYLHIYGVQGAHLNAQQLSIVAGLCEWRDTMARTEDESTGYILPNKTLLEIAKQMPLNTSKLRRLLKSKHPYVERNLSDVVSIIRLSVQNASAFEVVAAKLKESCIQAGRELNDAAADFPELRTAGGYSGAGSDGSPQECVAGSMQFSKNGYFKNVYFRNNSIISETQRGTHSFASRSNETNVAEASVQVLKKPIRAFGAMLGGSVSKQRTDFGKEKGENQLEQIRSTVNLPFYSFQPGDQLSKQSSKHAPEQQNKAVDAASLEKKMPSAAPALGSDSEDIILLESNQPFHDDPDHRVDALASSTKSEDVVILLDSDSDEEASPDHASGNDDDDHVDAADHQETNSTPELVVLDDDEEEGEDGDGDSDDDGDVPMSLTDLSSSLQKCLQSVNQNQTTQHNVKSEDAIPLQGMR